MSSDSESEAELPLISKRSTAITNTTAPAPIQDHSPACPILLTSTDPAQEESRTCDPMRADLVSHSITASLARSTSFMDASGQKLRRGASVLVSWDAGFQSLAYVEAVTDDGRMVLLDLAVSDGSGVRGRYQVAYSAVKAMDDNPVDALNRACEESNLLQIAAAAGLPTDADSLCQM